jgi:anti-anti-sigma regulatory factor
MLKITIHEGANVLTLQLEGKLNGPWVEELNRTWLSLTPALGSKKLQMDLRGVAFVDGLGRRLLQEIYQHTNASFLADTPLTRHFADDAMQEFLKDGEEGA